MKKFLVSLALVFVTCAGLNAGVKDALLLYIPNRIIDAFDMFSLDLGFGPIVGGDLRGTRACDFGGGVGAAAMAVKDYNRQYGGCLQRGSYWAFTCVGAEDMKRECANRWVQEYWHQYSGDTSPDDNIYDFHEGARDYWEVGAELALGAYVKFAFHPVEIGDFLAGVILIDLKGDDLTAESFN